MDGLIAVNKPSGCTSHDVVQRMRRCLGERRIGHFGTLDPLATGLLLVAVGQATRFFPYYSRSDKAYRGRLRLGLTTDTYDAQGRPTLPECPDLPSRERLSEAMVRLTGPGLQTPPAFSAKKIKGQPSYKLARSGKAVPLGPEKITVHFFRLEEYHPPWADFTVSCSAGTYIRSLAHDLGLSLGCGAYLESLCRLSSGEFGLDQAFLPGDIELMAGRGEYARFLRPLESLLPSFPKLRLKESGFHSVKNGKRLLPPDIEECSSSGPPDDVLEDRGSVIYRLFSPEGKLTALARREDDGPVLQPFLVLD